MCVFVLFVHTEPMYKETNSYILFKNMGTMCAKIMRAKINISRNDGLPCKTVTLGAGLTYRAAQQVHKILMNEIETSLF